MNCEQALTQMSAMLDGQQDPDQTEALRAHLADCPDCRRLMETLEGLDKKLSQLREPAPEGLKKGVLYRIDQASGRTKRSAARRWFGPGTAIGAVAAVLVLLVGLGVFPLANKGKDAAAPMQFDEAIQHELAPETQIPASLLPNEAPSLDDATDTKNRNNYSNQHNYGGNVKGDEPEQAEAMPTSDGYYYSGGKSELRGVPRAVTDPMRKACAALSQRENALVLLYSEFSPDTLFGLLETEAPALYELTQKLEPEAEGGLVRYATDCGTALAIQEWLLDNLPQSEIMEDSAREAETRLRIWMEELDPGSGSLYRIITWSPPAHPVAWPETWPEGWALRIRTRKNWELFFPGADYVPNADKPAYVVFSNVR